MNFRILPCPESGWCSSDPPIVGRAPVLKSRGMRRSAPYIDFNTIPYHPGWVVTLGVEERL